MVKSFFDDPKLFRADFPIRLLSWRRRQFRLSARISAFDFRKLRPYSAWQIRAIIRPGFMADTSRNNKEYPVSLPFLSNKSRAAHSRVYLSSIAQ